MRFEFIIMVFLLNFLPVVSAQEFAVEQLNDSPRHHEWVDVDAGQGRVVRSFVAYPENKDNTLAVIVIHENRGLTDWVRSFSDQLAAAGYVAIAPDLLSDFDDEHKRTSDFESADDAKNAIYELDQAQVTVDLKAVQKFAAGLSSANGKTAVIGFCWGGKQAFQFSATADNLSAALVFYGSPPADELIPAVSAPVYGFYGEDDQRINATIPATAELMKEYAKVYDYEIYPGAGHAYMRSGDDPQGSAENKSACDQSWVRLKNILSQLNK